jgi:hypothetical protein
MTEAVVLINSFEVPAADAAEGLVGYRPHPALYRPVRA